MRKAVFLDRDGTINEDVGYLFAGERLKFIPRAIEGMLALQNRFDLFVVTNQTGIGEKIFTIQDYQHFERQLKALLAAHGVDIRCTYCCPHLKEDACICRKPSPHFLREAVEEFNIDLAGSYVIGDHPHDIEMGKSAGTKTVYVLSGHGEKHREEMACSPNYVAKDLYAASLWILDQ
jgi:histidinol-phosphate phosphatase family protein